MNLLESGGGVVAVVAWILLIVTSIVVTIRAMLALARVPARLEAIERAIRESGGVRDNRVP